MNGWDLRDEKFWYLGLLVLAAYITTIFWFRWKSHVVKQAGDQHLMREMIQNLSLPRQAVRAFSVLVAFTLVYVALLRPRGEATVKQVKRMGVDVVFALDISKSMYARDVSPDRLRAAKLEIQSLMQKLPNSRVGLVAFAGVAFAQSALTFDKSAIQLYLSKLAPNLLPVGGTAIGAAIDEAIEVHTGRKKREKLEEAGTELPKRRSSDTKLIVLFTDGEDHAGNADKMAQIAKEQGIKLVVVGVGGSIPVPIPEYKKNGDWSGHMKFEGAPVTTALQDESLRKMADDTQGMYLSLMSLRSESGGVAQAVADYINQQETSIQEEQWQDAREEKYHFFLIPAFILLFFEALIGERRRKLKGVERV